MAKRIILAMVMLFAITASGCFSEHGEYGNGEQAGAGLHGEVQVESGGKQTVKEQKRQIDIYEEYLRAKKVLEPTANPEEYGENSAYEVEKLMYNMCDLNNDGIFELICSDAMIGGNGVMIFTIDGGQVKEFCKTYFPYSTRGEVYSVAEINEFFGLFTEVNDDTKKFTFSDFDGNEVLSGEIKYNSDGETGFILCSEECAAEVWYDAHGQIELVPMWNFDAFFES